MQLAYIKDFFSSLGTELSHGEQVLHDDVVAVAGYLSTYHVHVDHSTVTAALHGMFDLLPASFVQEVRDFLGGAPDADPEVTASEQPPAEAAPQADAPALSPAEE